ncbi:MAG: tRNA lysidine(34) synthetase TilS, partial [Pseudomonadota bacterium]
MSRWPEFAPGTLAETTHRWLAFSGGPDSVCLLHQLIQLEASENLTVVHVDHGLDAQSSQRARHAVELAQALGIDCRLERLDRSELDRTGGPEAAARHARYARLQSLMSADDYLLTAHHADDQIETMLLRLLRGSGARGLSGMQSLRPLKPGWLARPLLQWSQQHIHDYLQQHQLTAIDDSTNYDCSLDRNFLRHRVLPLIAKRWPGYRHSLLQSIELMAAAGRTLEAQAESDFEQLLHMQADEITLEIEPWLKLEPVYAFEVIRHWCRTTSIEPPPAARLQEFFEQCQSAATDRQPTLDWQPASLRRWSDALWLDRTPKPPANWQLHGMLDDKHELDIELPHDIYRFRYEQMLAGRVRFRKNGNIT